jgi:hypothetical protein
VEEVVFKCQTGLKPRTNLEELCQRDLSSPDRRFNIEGVEREKTSKLCAWNVTDLDVLVSKFPTGLPDLGLPGIFYKFFNTFKEDYYARAMPEFQRVARLSRGLGKRVACAAPAFGISH